MSDYKHTLDKVRFSEQDKQNIYFNALEQAPKGFSWGLVYKPLIVLMAMLTLFFGSRMLFEALQRPDPLQPLTATPSTGEAPTSSEASTEPVLTTEPAFNDKGYPWNESITVDKLPAYKNESLWVDTAYQGGLTNLDMTQMVETMAAQLGVTIDRPFAAGNWEGTVEFSDVNELKAEYTTITYSGESLELQVTRSGMRTIYVLHDNATLAADIVEKLLQPMSLANDSLGFMDPVVLRQEVTQNAQAQTSSEGLNIIPSQLLAFEKGDTFAEQLFNYDADRLEIVQAEGVIAIQRYKPEAATVSLVKDYKVISLQEAQDQLIAGHYVTGQYFPEPELDKVSAVDLRYDLDRESNYFIPYYVFEVTFPKTGGSDLMYYAVQALEERFNQEQPDYVRNKEAILPGR